MKIDYFEFLVLIEASWYAGTILKHSIMEKAINKWYFDMSKKEKAAAYAFFNRIKGDDSDRKKEIQQRFLARFNPENQYLVSTECEGIKEEIETYRFKDNYYISNRTKIDIEYIFKVKHYA